MICRVRPDGVIVRVAGRVSVPPAPDTTARMGFFDDIQRIQVAANGDLYLTMFTRVYVVTPEGDYLVGERRREVEHIITPAANPQLYLVRGTAGRIGP